MELKDRFRFTVDEIQKHVRRDGKPITHEQISEELGLTREYFSRLYNGKNPVNERLLNNLILRFPDVTKNITFDHLGESEPSYGEKRRKQKIQNTGPYMVPFMSVKAQAGYVKAIDQEVYLDTLEKYALPPGISGHGAIWRYWEIEGDSMEPVFREGDIILTSFVHPMDWENLKNFYTYVIVTPERVLIKRIYCKNELEWVLISENEENYPQQLIPVESIKEVWIYRRTFSTRAEPTKRFEIKV